MTLISKLQNAVRSRYRTKLLMQYRVSLLRPMYITISRCFDLPVGDRTGSADPFVIMTVIDAMYTDHQFLSFRTVVKNQTLNPCYSERFLVPGLSGKQILVFTVVDEDDVRHQCLGQAAFKMGPPAHAWKHGGSFILGLGPVKYVPKIDGSSMRLDYSSIKPAGNIEVRDHTIVFSAFI